MNRGENKVPWPRVFLLSAALVSLSAIVTSARAQSDDELALSELKTTAAENRLAQVNSGIANFLDSVGSLEGVENPEDFARITPAAGFAGAVGGGSASIADSTNGLSRLTGAAQASVGGLRALNGVIQGVVQGQEPISQSDAINISR